MSTAAVGHIGEGVDWRDRCNGQSAEALRAALAAPFPPEFIDWKPLKAGWKGDPTKPGATPWVQLMAYIDARAIQERLDDVCGVHNWRDEYQYPATGGVMCGLSIKFGDEWVTKWDGAEQSDIEKVKGGVSNALKRAAVKWGIGRYLYDLGLTWGEIAADNDYDAKQITPKDRQKNDQKPFRWRPKRLPAWALPGGSGKPGLVSEEQRKRGEKAAEALKPTPAEDTILVGTKAHFNGQGGKRLRDIPTRDLETVLDKLRAIGSAQYDGQIADVTAVIAARKESGA